MNCKDHEPPESLDDEILLPDIRDELFKKAGLQRDVSQMDHLDRDILILSVRFLTAEELSAKYPSLERAKLDILRQLLVNLREAD